MRLYNLTEDEVQLIKDFRAACSEHQGMLLGLSAKLAVIVPALPVFADNVIQLVASK